jgi:UDP-GlcNAc:undecaprenyl-phosphate/decaprenyl-phosphate GlcNAc-1-phosphate transferase
MALSPIYATVLAGFVALIVCAIMSPVIIRFATHRGVMDKPDERKCHEKPIPQLGGTAVFAGVIASVFIVFPFMPHEMRPDEIYGVMGISLGAALSFIIGLFDDLFGIKPAKKFLFQVIVATGGILFGIKIGFLQGYFTDYIYLSGPITVLATIFWVTALMNAVNLIDGLDGLATGISAIAAAAFMILALMNGQVAAGLLSAAVLGASLGFLPFNFYPAKIFLGDAGSLLLGYLLATISILGPFKTTTALTVVVPILILGLPLFDTSWAIVRRTAAHKKIHEADNDHVHHRLSRKGFGHKGTVLILYGVAAILAVIAIFVGRP